MKQYFLNHLKNIYGWKTKRKLLAFAVDDYGNVRLDSKKSSESMLKAGLKVNSRFDMFDTLETRVDLEMLFDTLRSVKDQHNKHAVFTTFAMPCNINFELMRSEGFQNYKYELLPETFEKLSALSPQFYEGTWSLWKDAINNSLLVPQFHGREHLNVNFLNERLQQKDFEVLTALNNRSYTSISISGKDSINFTAAFDFLEMKENDQLEKILIDGIYQFKQVFGLSPIVFMPPTSKIHPMHYPLLMENGIKFIDINLLHDQHMGNGKISRTINYTGKKLETGQQCIVRNVVFEPTANLQFDSVKLAMDQIEAAFFWNRPAIISSHRVNFCGHISTKNREHGLKALNELLKKITLKWPDVEFISIKELADLIE